MAIKIVVAFLICLILGEIISIQARITPKKSVHVQRERFLCERPQQGHPLEEAYESCLHNCVKPCPRDDQQKFFECELSCDLSFQFKKQKPPAKDGCGKEKKETEEKVTIPKTGPVTRVYTVCYDKCSSDCASNDVKCLTKCDKMCSKVSEYKIRKNARKE